MYEALNNQCPRALRTPDGGDAVRRLRRDRPSLSAERATDGGTRGGRASPVHYGRVLSTLGMRQPVVSPSSSVDVPLTSQRARKRESGRHVTRRRPHL